MIRVIYNKEYYIPHKLYTHFLCDKLEYYFAEEEYTYFRNFKLKELKNEKIF